MVKEHAGALVDEWQRGGEKGGLLELVGGGGVRESTEEVAYKSWWSPSGGSL